MHIKDIRRILDNDDPPPRWVDPRLVLGIEHERVFKTNVQSFSAFDFDDNIDSDDAVLSEYLNAFLITSIIEIEDRNVFLKKLQTKIVDAAMFFSLYLCSSIGASRMAGHFSNIVDEETILNLNRSYDTYHLCKGPPREIVWQFIRDYFYESFQYIDKSGCVAAKAYYRDIYCEMKMNELYEPDLLL